MLISYSSQRSLQIQCMVETHVELMAQASCGEGFVTCSVVFWVSLVVQNLNEVQIGSKSQELRRTKWHKYCNYSPHLFLCPVLVPSQHGGKGLRMQSAAAVWPFAMASALLPHISNLCKDGTWQEVSHPFHPEGKWMPLSITGVTLHWLLGDSPASTLLLLQLLPAPEMQWLGWTPGESSEHQPHIHPAILTCNVGDTNTWTENLFSSNNDFF